MLTKRIIPCLDVKEGKVVKGINFVGIKDVGDPVEIAKVYNAEGADELVFLEKQKLFVIGSEVLDVRSNDYAKEWEELLVRTKKIFDYVIVDTPPMGMFPDAEILADLVDASVLVVRQDYCNRIALNDAVHQFDFVNSKILGVVMNCASDHNSQYEKGYYRKYYRRYHKYSKKTYEQQNKTNGHQGK